MLQTRLIGSVRNGRTVGHLSVSGASHAPLTFWETRQAYPNFVALAEDLQERTGRSILHELNAEGMQELIAFIARHIPHDAAIVEKDCWTMWRATRAYSACRCSVLRLALAAACRARPVPD